MRAETYTRLGHSAPASNKSLKIHFKIIILLMNLKKNQIEPSLFAQQSALKHPILSSYIPIN